MTTKKNPHAVALGRRGGVESGKVRSKKRAAASRRNGKKGGRPRKIVVPPVVVAAAVADPDPAVE